MKETQKHVPDKVQEIKIPKESQQKYEGTIRLQPGHKMFEYEPETQTIRNAIFEEIAVVFDSKKATQKKIVVRPGLKYVHALNWRNALRKINKLYPTHTPKYEKQ